MISKIAVNTKGALHGRAGETLRRSLLAVPGVRQVTVSHPGRVEVHYDGAATGAGALMSVIRAHGTCAGCR